MLKRVQHCECSKDDELFVYEQRHAENTNCEKLLKRWFGDKKSSTHRNYTNFRLCFIVSSQTFSGPSYQGIYIQDQKWFDNK